MLSVKLGRKRCATCSSFHPLRPSIGFTGFFCLVIHVHLDVVVILSPDSNTGVTWSHNMCPVVGLHIHGMFLEIRVHIGPKYSGHIGGPTSDQLILHSPASASVLKLLSESCSLVQTNACPNTHTCQQICWFCPGQEAPPRNQQVNC